MPLLAAMPSGDIIISAAGPVNLPRHGERIFRSRDVTGLWEKYTVSTYYYTLSFGEREEKAEVSLDAELSGSSGWVLIGEYDLPAGEVSVTLSDKEVRRRKEVAIAADAVKWIKVE